MPIVVTVVGKDLIPLKFFDSSICSESEKNYMKRAERKDKAAEMAFQFLDTIDISKKIQIFKGKDFNLLKSHLNDAYRYGDEYSECLFDNIDDFDFMDYLREVYDVCIDEYVVYKIR